MTESKNVQTSMSVRFGAFEVDLEGRRLLKGGVPISLREQSFQVLAALIELSLSESPWYGLLGFSMEAALNRVGLREAESDGGQVQGNARAQKRDREFSSGAHTMILVLVRWKNF